MVSVTTFVVVLDDCKVGVVVPGVMAGGVGGVGMGLEAARLLAAAVRVVSVDPASIFVLRNRLHEAN